MSNGIVNKLHELTKCLEEASGCILHLPDAAELESIHHQLESLRLILDRNLTALRLTIADLKSKDHLK